MKYNENHPKEILDKVHCFEKKHITFLKNKLERNTEFEVEYIYEKVLFGIHRKKNNVETFHPGPDRFLENIFSRIRHRYYDIISKYKSGHIVKLNDELDSIKAWMIKDFDRENYSELEFFRVNDFIHKFSISQATNFIVRDIVYEKMIHNPVFIFPSENPKHKKHEPKLEGVVKTDYSEDVDTLSSMNRKIIELEGRIEDSNGRNEMLDANGAAKLTGYSVNTIRQKTSDRTIPFHKLPNGSAVRYSKTELLEWMESGNGKKRESLFDNIANGIRQKHK